MTILLSLAAVWPRAGAAADAGPGAGSGSVPAELPAPGLEPPDVHASASAAQVALGEVFYLFIQVTHPPGVHVNLPAALPIGPAFEETARTSHETRNDDGTMTRHFEVALMAFDVGDLAVPAIPVTWAAQGAAHEVRAPPVPIIVLSAIGDGEERLRDIAPPVKVLRTNWSLLYALGGIAAALVAGLVFLLLRAALSGRRRSVAAAAAPIDPVAEALAKLEALEAAGALEADDLKPAYHEMSEVIREYLGRVFDFPALDLTTHEIRTQLRLTPGAEEADREIGEWLERCDLVKFAGYGATAEEARDALYEARLVIEKVRQRPESDPGAEVA